MVLCKDNLHVTGTSCYTRIEWWWINSSTSFINKNMYFLISIYITYPSNMLLAENKTSAPKKFVPFTAMRVNLFLEKIFKYKRPKNKSLHLGRVRGLAYVHCEYLRLFNVWLLFSVALSPWQIFRLELSLFLPVEELLEKLEKIASIFKKIINVWNILVTLYC